jgi:hypothetical protein
MTILRVTRREFVAGLGGAAAWPTAVRAQPTQIVGFLSAGKLETYDELVPRLLGGCRQLVLSKVEM